MNPSFLARNVLAQRQATGRLVARALATHASNASQQSHNHQAKNDKLKPLLWGALFGSAAAAVVSSTVPTTKLEASSCPYEHAPTEESKSSNPHPGASSKLQATSAALPSVTMSPDEHHQIPPNNMPPPRPDLPTYSMDEVAEHADEDDMWFTFRGGVYNMSFFAQGHPGGFPVCTMGLDLFTKMALKPVTLIHLLPVIIRQRLMMAAGQDLEPYWNVYRQHFRGHVIEWMEKYRIGNVSPEEAEANKKVNFGDMFETDPERSPDLLPCTSRPFNGEPRIELVSSQQHTNISFMYILASFDSTQLSWLLHY